MPTRSSPPAQEAISAERNQTMVLDDDGLLFAEALVPPPRLVVVGAVDTADSLCRMAGALGWRTVVIDPRRAFATAERIPSAGELVVKWPEEGYDEIELRPEDHVVVLTHDPKLDDPAIAGALRRGVGYVGALGSRRTQEKRRDRLRESGVTRRAAGAHRRAGRARHRGAHAGGDRRSRSWPRSSRCARAATADACATPRDASTWSTRASRRPRPSAPAEPASAVVRDEQVPLALALAQHHVAAVQQIVRRPAAGPRRARRR